MNAKNHKNLIIILITIFAACCFSAQKTDALIKRGNTKYYDANYADANQLYSQALSIDPDNTIAAYNKANTLFKQGNFNQAIDMYKIPASQSEYPKLADNAKYNLAAANLNLALQDTQTPTQDTAEIEKKIDALKNSIADFRDIITEHPDNTNARDNIQLGKVKLKQLQKILEQAKQQQQQNQDKNSDPNQPNDDQKNNDQNDPNDPNDQKNDDKEQNQQDQGQDEKKQEDENKSQQDQPQQKQIDATAKEILDKEENTRKIQGVIKGSKEVEKDW